MASRYYQYTGRTMQHLILAYQQSKDIKTRNLIAKHYLYLAKNLANKAAKNVDGIQQEDLEQEAAVELIESIDDYNPAKGTLFSTFAYSRIVGRLQQFLRDKVNLIRVPQNLYALNGKINKARILLKSSLSNPSESDIINYLGITEKEYFDAQNAMLAFNPNIISVEEVDISDSLIGLECEEEIICNTKSLSKLEAPGNRRKAWAKTINESSSTNSQ